MSYWPRGSEWRKWDLHLHSPGTRLSDQYQVQDEKDKWTEYCRLLHESEVHAFGITDYFSADGYFATVTAYRKQYPSCQKLLLPNVELRTNEIVNKEGQHVHIHLLFNPFQPKYKENISKVLGLLETNRTDGNRRNITVAELSEKLDLEAATTTKESISAALKKTFGSTADITDYVLVICAVNDGGIRTHRGLSGAKRREEISDELDKLSDALFGNASNRAHYLGTSRYNKGGPALPKPVLSGCDAHSFKDLEERLGKVAYGKDKGIIFAPTWIKADLTFEGLKQILFEPDNRVYIGEEPEVEQRVRAHKNKYIDSLHISSEEGYAGRCGKWFEKEHIVFGKELVAIIGNKGSGKSAVADIIGLLGNSHNQKLPGKPGELFSFLTKEKFRKGKCAANFCGELRWHDGAPNRKNLDTDVSEALPEKVEYLPQKYIERICTDIAHDEFRFTLNEVIFEYVRKEDRYDQKDFDHLIAYLTKHAKEQIDARKHDLHEANELIVSIEKKLVQDYRSELEGKIEIRKRDIRSHTDVKPSAKPTPDLDLPHANADTAELERITAQIDDFEKEEKKLAEEQIATKKALGDLKRVRQEIERAATTFTQLEKTHETVLKDAGLSFQQIIKIAIEYGTLDNVIEEKKRRSDQISALLLTIDDINLPEGAEGRQEAVDESVVCRRVALEKKKGDIIERLGAPQREYQAYLNALSAWTTKENELLGGEKHPVEESLRGLQRELASLTTIYPADLATAKTARDEIAKDILRQKTELTSFYESVKKSIDMEIAKHQKDLENYDISIEAGLRFQPDFYEQFFARVNQSVKGSFLGVEDGKTSLKKWCDVVGSWEHEQEVFAVLNEMIDALHFDRREEFSGRNEERNVFKQIRNGQGLIELYDYLFGFDYLITKYDLMVDGKDVSELSPGERGGLLLVFYLMLDKRDIPLIIDQPEDNLDNESVYRILAMFLKKAKKRRQIIIVTHNPNLAVGADAEQIIRVTIDKKEGKNEFDFYAGSIENEKINKAVVDILEGTLPAFDNRRLKYRR
jgi:ABC-type lipoprotein export system ATPase subunit